MTAETVPFPEQQITQPDYRPRLIPDEEASPEVQARLSEIFGVMRSCPTEMLVELQEFEENPAATPPNSIWRTLTEHRPEEGDSYARAYTFDAKTRAIINSDPACNLLRERHSKDAFTNGRSLRIRALTIFLERLEQTNTDVARGLAQASLQAAE